MEKIKQQIIKLLEQKDLKVEDIKEIKKLLDKIEKSLNIEDEDFWN